MGVEGGTVLLDDSLFWTTRHWGDRGGLGELAPTLAILVFFPSCAPLFGQFNRVAMGTICTAERTETSSVRTWV